MKKDKKEDTEEDEKEKNWKVKKKIKQWRTSLQRNTKIIMNKWELCRKAKNTSVMLLQIDCLTETLCYFI